MLRLPGDVSLKLPYLRPGYQRPWEGTSSEYSATIIGDNARLRGHGKRTSG
jgi:hypothetical protein